MDLSAKLREITTGFVQFTPRGLVLRVTVLGWIVIYLNWSIVTYYSPVCKVDILMICSHSFCKLINNSSRWNKAEILIATMFGCLILVKIFTNLFLPTFRSRDLSNTQDNVWPHFQTPGSIFNSLLGVKNCDQTPSFEFDILRQPRTGNWYKARQDD